MFDLLYKSNYTYVGLIWKESILVWSGCSKAIKAKHFVGGKKATILQWAQFDAQPHKYTTVFNVMGRSAILGRGFDLFYPAQNFYILGFIHSFYQSLKAYIWASVKL